jgi:site-specific DNA-methyltransferase (adenine-specific)
MGARLMKTQAVIEGDCLTVMHTMPAGSVHTAVFSPPYNLGKPYSLHNDKMPEAEYLDWQSQVAQELARVIRPDGHVFLNVGFSSVYPRRAEDVAIKYEMHFVRQQTICWVKALAIDARTIRDDAFRKALVPWAKEHGIDLRTLPCNELRKALHEYTIGHFRPIKSPRLLGSFWEPIYHLTPQGTSPIDTMAIGVPYVYDDQPARFGHGRDKHSPGDVWHVPYSTRQSTADVDHHPAIYPIELAQRCLRLAAVPPDGLVLDPFCGIGTTLIAAKTLNLSAVGIELDPAYCAAARRRINSDIEIVANAAK